ncbi:UDP-glucuronate 4-epimerase 6-like [Salvia miltiorrhiza]|uniref:UDP-glucuronate 4-epimerase 6-like n=1 Tax=Salvia miltiorrhiza TaxID=226208 RepID=UPI0025AC965B|nr:UDP-glucuronate 4-epimerase 6-like [Salvia miltiorrhiza]
MDSSVPFSHILHLATQAGVWYAIQNPLSYVNSNITGFVTLLEVAKAADPQPAIVWASTSTPTHRSFSPSPTAPTAPPASTRPPRKPARPSRTLGVGRLGIGGRGSKGINVYVTQEDKEVARDFTYIDDIVKGCVGALDMAEKSTCKAGKK